MLKKILKIDGSIYDINTLKRCAKEFENEGFYIKFTGDSLEVLGETQAEIKEIIGEFMNYVLSSSLSN